MDNPRHVEGFRWYIIQAVGLLQLVLAPRVYIPWLPADKVLIASSFGWPVWAVLVCAFTLSLQPLDQMGLSFVRFLSASMQGLIAGHLLVFDSSTLYARFTWALALGIANALDRLAMIEHVRNRLSKEDMQIRPGSAGRMRYKGKEYEVVVTKVQGDQLCVKYDKSPFWVGDTETVGVNESRLTVNSGVALEGLVVDHLNAGFRLRPLGFTFGVCLSQWLLYGFTVGDSFVSGMLTGQALVIFSPPLLILFLYYLSTTEDDCLVGLFLFVLGVGACCLYMVCLLPVTVSMVTFAIAELWAHQIVVFVAIPADACFFYYIMRPTAEDIAKYGFFTMLLNADSYLTIARAQFGGVQNKGVQNAGMQNKAVQNKGQLRAPLLNA